MTLIPNTWENTSLGLVARVRNGYAFKSAEFTLSGVPLVRQSNLSGDTVDLSKCAYLPVDYLAEFRRFSLTKGDILIGMSGSVGKLCIFNQDIVALQNQRTGKIELISENDCSERYVWHFLKTIEGQLINKSKGVAVANVSSEDIQSVPFPLAPLAEQKRIADKLDTVLTCVDAVNERLARVAPILKRFRQSVLAAATSGRLTEDWRVSSGVESEWQVTDVQTVAHVGTGSTPLRSNAEFFAESGTPWVTSAATSQEVVSSAAEYVTQAAISAHRLKVYPVGTLLVAMYGEGKTRGQVTQLGIPATINQACAAVVVDESKMLRDFVKLALQANYLEMRILAEGGNQPNLNLAKVKSFPLPLPSREEQTEIVRRVETMFAFADRLEARLQAAQTAADRLTPSLLAKAFRGELVPQDPNDEPAAELLKRLAANEPAKVKRGRRPTTEP